MFLVPEILSKTASAYCGIEKILFLLDLRQSRQSLVSHFDGRQSRQDTRASKRSLNRQPSRSRSRDRLTAGGPGYLDRADPRDNDSLGEDSDNWAGTGISFSGVEMLPKNSKLQG